MPVKKRTVNVVVDACQSIGLIIHQLFRETNFSQLIAV